MASIGDLKIDVNLNVSDETAIACIAVLNMYLKNNPERGIYTEKFGDESYTRIEIYNKNATTKQ